MDYIKYHKTSGKNCYVCEEAEVLTTLSFKQDNKPKSSSKYTVGFHNIFLFMYVFFNASCPVV